MNLLKHHQQFGLVLIILIIGCINFISAQEPEIIRTISYKEILNAQMTPIAAIERMKISADGGRIVFNTVGGELYTINTDGTGLTKILAQDGRGFVDINADGSFIIFARLFGYEIKVFNSLGGGGTSVANNLPLPNGGTTGPDIRLNPVIVDSAGESGLETRIFFTAVAGGPDVAGVWSVGNDGTNLKQHFSYRQVSQQLFGLDGSEYNGNVAFQQGFDVAENGRRIVVGTWNFQAAGHTILWDEFTGLQILRNYGPARSDVPAGLTISHDGHTIVLTKPIPGVLGASVESIDFNSGQSVDLINNIGTSPIVQMTSVGKVLGKGDSAPLILLNTDGSARLDLINSPSLGGSGDPFYRNSIGPTISITAAGNRFAFVSALNYNDYTRLWVADIEPGFAASVPTISNINLLPNYVVVNGGSFASFSAAISAGSNSVLRAGFSGFNNGTYEHIIGNSNSYWLWDDGTHGDLVAGDGVYGAESVFTPITENPNPGHPYMIRFSARTEHRVTVVDVEPFYIRNTPVGVGKHSKSTRPNYYELKQNFPNPFNPVTTIAYDLPISDFVTLTVYDLNGQEVMKLVDKKQSAGNHWIQFDGSKLASGVYIFRLHTSQFDDSKKFILIK